MRLVQWSDSPGWTISSYFKWCFTLSNFDKDQNMTFLCLLSEFLSNFIYKYVFCWSFLPSKYPVSPLNPLWLVPLVTPTPPSFSRVRPIASHGGFFPLRISLGPSEFGCVFRRVLRSPNHRWFGDPTILRGDPEWIQKHPNICQMRLHFHFAFVYFGILEKKSLFSFTTFCFGILM